MQCARVKKTLGSAHKTNQNGNVIIVDGKGSFMVNKVTGKHAPIEYENGQYFFSAWVKSNGKDEIIVKEENVLKGNKFAALAVEEDKSGFARRG